MSTNACPALSKIYEARLEFPCSFSSCLWSRAACVSILIQLDLSVSRFGYTKEISSCASRVEEKEERFELSALSKKRFSAITPRMEAVNLNLANLNSAYVVHPQRGRDNFERYSETTWRWIASELSFRDFSPTSRTRNIFETRHLQFFNCVSYT